MDTGLQQFSGDWLLFSVSLLSGIAVFLLACVVLSGPLQRLIDRLFPGGEMSWRFSKTFHVPLGPFGGGGDLASTGPEAKAGWGTLPLAGVGNEPAARPLDPARREHYLVLWRQAQDRFAHEPAEAVREAERLLVELMRETGSPSIVQNRTATFYSDAEFGAALAEVGSMFRMARNARAAARGIRSTKAHGDASIDDLRHAMELYRWAFEQRLGAEHKGEDFPGTGTETSAESASAPYDRPPGRDSAEETARDGADTGWVMGAAKGPSSGRAEVGPLLAKPADVLERILLVPLGVAAITILVGGVYIMLSMDAGSRSQGGRFYVAIIMLVMLGAVDVQFTRLLRRRRRPSPTTLHHKRGPDGRMSYAESFSRLILALTMTPTDDERRFALGSLLLLLFLGVVLVAFALLFP